MSEVQNFRPKWASPPGETIKDAFEDLGLSPSAFSASIGIDSSHLPELLTGNEPISIDLARRIVESIGGSVEFWMTRDGQYRDDLARVEAANWAMEFPTTFMASLGWINKPTDWQSQIDVCLNFFNVKNLPEWRVSYGTIVETAKFRTTSNVKANPYAIAAWLRQAEMVASQQNRSTWSPEDFRVALNDIRRLTRVSDPKRFLPELESLCNDVGVAVVILRVPTGCPVSGATQFIDVDAPLIALSARYLTDDQFWFSFFHEAGHILMHDPANVFVDELDKKIDRPSSQDEIEADAFAGNILFPTSVREELLKGRPTPALLHRLSRNYEVSTGILVGQLQHQGTLSYGSVFNRLKKRYRWNGTTLEKA